jgi:hypothetical protein
LFWISNDWANNKGIYYGDEKEKQFFEGGAHFKYIKLYRILENLAKERNCEKGKELYVIKKNIFSNNNLNKKKSKEIKSRNIASYLDSNKTSYNTLSVNNINNRNESCNFHHQTFLTINKNIKNKLRKNFSIKNQKKTILSRNKNSLLLFKGRPNTILKEELNNLLHKKNNHLISSSLEYNNNNKNNNNNNNCFTTINHKRSLPELNNNKFSHYNKSNNKSKISLTNKDCFSQNEIDNLSSYIEVNKIGLKTERFNTLDDQKNYENPEIMDIKNKSQYNFNKGNYLNSIDINRKPKIKGKNIGGNKSNNILEKTKSYVTSDFNEKVHNMKNNLNNKDKNKEIIINKVNKINKKKNIKKNFIIHNNTFLTKINFNNQFMRIINESNKPSKMQFEKIRINNNYTSSNKKSENKKRIDRNILNKFKFNQASFTKFIKKSRNLNGISNATNSLNTFGNKGMINSTTNRNFEKYKNNFKTMVLMDTISNKIGFNETNRESNNPKLNINNLEMMNKSTPKIKKKVFTNSASNNANQLSKTKLLIKPYSQIKVNNGLKNNIHKKSNPKNDYSMSNNTISDARNKTLNNNNIKTTGVYVKPKHFQCCLKKKSCNSKNINLNKIDNHISSFNNTQKPLVKKKAIIKISK